MGLDIPKDGTRHLTRLACPPLDHVSNTYTIVRVLSLSHMDMGQIYPRRPQYIALFCFPLTSPCRAPDNMDDNEAIRKQVGTFSKGQNGILTTQ
eukprot:4977207-Amphidinium_carterae.1